MSEIIIWYMLFILAVISIGIIQSYIKWKKQYDFHWSSYEQYLENEEHRKLGIKKHNHILKTDLDEINKTEYYVLSYEDLWDLKFNQFFGDDDEDTFKDVIKKFRINKRK